ncbi:hypothetical protein TTHERM_00947650 (macronuclear) [Tetrahymena thermophila SB210]|uniref:Uncharacterized protein n=1 Tax=Tetrahymena thermophila (strain SB210) TaxID=312017 RepID=I7LSV8_TETTS|nr:hypothetical protein TTHERM_00947650 [Tetrahymena thermophila SB210]EAR83338.1 hypothetical protein TTHERM_00947650 [Tetrahymena thermophila SB210]|eukprot:XP_001031001.1 hypothetical protein TTHERM_00947650 [Tetrahymena thermophila SB210]
MSSILHSIKKKADESDFFEFNINNNDSNYQKNSVLLKDMIFSSKVDKATQNIINNKKNNIILQKWNLHESQRSGLNSQKTQELKEETTSSPQKQRRLSQTSTGKNLDSKGASPKKINEASPNIFQQDYKKQNHFQDTNRIHSQRNDSSRQASSPKELVKTVELQLDTNDRYTENLNKINFFTERTSSLIEMNKKKKNKEQKSYQKSPQNAYQNKNNEFDSNKNFQQTQSGNNQEETLKNIIMRTNFSNLLTNQGSNVNIVGQDNQFINEVNSQQILRHLIVGVDGNNKKRDRNSILNKSDNEIRFGQQEDLDKKEQNMSQSDIYLYSGEKYIQPKRKLLEFPQQESKQFHLQSQNRHQVKKPFISGAQSHINNQGSNQLPNIKQNLKKSSQSPFRYTKHELNINDNTSSKNNQTLISEYLNRTIYSPNQKNDTNTIQVSDSQMYNTQYKTNTRSNNNNILAQNVGLPDNKAITQTQVSENQNKFSEINNNRNFTQIDFFQVNQLSPLVMKRSKIKSSSMNQQRNSDFIEINKKNLKFISNKKKNAYNQIVDSIIKQHEIKEKDEKKAASKDKRIKLQQMFKQKSIQSKNQIQNNQNQNLSNFSHNLTTTIASDFNQYANSNHASPVMRANTSLTNRNTQNTDTDFFQPQGKALRNKQYNEQMQKLNQQNIEQQMKQNSQTTMSFYPPNEKIPQLQDNSNNPVQQFAISYQLQQQIQFKRKMKSRQNRKQKQITVEEQINNEQIKQKLINLQQQKSSAYNLNLSPQNKLSNTLINDSKILNNSQIMSNLAADQLQMALNLQKQASQIKRQQQQITKSDQQSQLVQNALSSAGQNMLLIRKWNIDDNRNNNNDYSEKIYLKKSTTSAGPRKKQNQQNESEVTLVDENIFSVNYRPKYVHDKTELGHNNYLTSKKKVKSSKGIKINESNDITYTVKNRDYDSSPKFKNEILPWEINDQQQYYEESEDICNPSRV